MKTKTVPLSALVDFCDAAVRRREVPDFDGAWNGLQCENRAGTVAHIGAAVDAGLATFERAAMAGVDFLIVHHGLLWGNPVRLTGPHFARVDRLLANQIALYGAHLPLDCHETLGNNAILAKQLGLKIAQWELPFEGKPMVATVADCPTRAVLRARLQRCFPGGFTAIEKGPARPKKIAIVTGSGVTVVRHLREIGVDTLITGEVRQANFVDAEDEGLNLYLCGHYATEVFGVQALAAAAARKFGLPCTWLGSDCPL